MATETATLPRDQRMAALAIAQSAGVFSVISRWIRRRQQVRLTVDLLNSLDDHLLADIGLIRDQVEQAARGDHLPARCFGGSDLGRGYA